MNAPLIIFRMSTFYSEQPNCPVQMWPTFLRSENAFGNQYEFECSQKKSLFSNHKQLEAIMENLRSKKVFVVLFCFVFSYNCTHKCTQKFRRVVRYRGRTEPVLSKMTGSLGSGLYHLPQGDKCIKSKV